MSTETRTRKRPYQPSINSYFHARNAAPSSSAPSSSAPESARSPLSPPLPEETQASLLSVGMRVRKSVPEGYKTHKTVGTMEYPFPSSAPVRQVEKSYANGNGGMLKELQPFCGLHKIGGLGAQVMPASSAPAGLGGWDEDELECPGMGMSQSTVSSQGSFGSVGGSKLAESGRKRSYEEEVEEDLEALFDDHWAEPAGTVMRRPIAKLKQPIKTATQGSVRIFGQDDFDDAAFLAPMDVD